MIANWIKMAVVALAALVAVGCGSSYPLQTTGPYTMKGMSGIGCQHTGPGWIRLPETGQVFHVKDAYYCAQDTVTAVIPFRGARFDILVAPWDFTKTESGE